MMNSMNNSSNMTRVIFEQIDANSACGIFWKQEAIRLQRLGKTEEPFAIHLKKKLIFWTEEFWTATGKSKVSAIVIRVARSPHYRKSMISRQLGSDFDSWREVPEWTGSPVFYSFGLVSFGRV